MSRIDPNWAMDTRRRAARVLPEDIARDRVLWAALLEQRSRSGALPPHTGAGYGNRRFAILRNAAWITLYRAVAPGPHIGVFLRCTGPAGEALFTALDRCRHDIEPRLIAELGPGAELCWGRSDDTSRINGKCIIITTIAAPYPWDDAATGLQIAWLLRVGAIWWRVFSAAVEPVADSAAML